jgi:hypothetical protein
MGTERVYGSIVSRLLNGSALDLGSDWALNEPSLSGALLLPLTTLVTRPKIVYISLSRCNIN